MKDIKTKVCAGSLAAGALFLFLTLSAQAAAPAFLPGITSKDAHPNGCVDCHVNAGAGKDYRVTAELAANVKGHPNIAKIVKNVPADCKACHKDGGTTPPPLSVVMHKSHYVNPTKNAFVTVYQGACLNCHSLDPATGAVKNKSGAANW